MVRIRIAFTISEAHIILTSSSHVKIIPTITFIKVRIAFFSELVFKNTSDQTTTTNTTTSIILIMVKSKRLPQTNPYPNFLIASSLVAWTKQLVDPLLEVPFVEVPFLVVVPFVGITLVVMVPFVDMTFVDLTLVVMVPLYMFVVALNMI